MTVRDFIEGLVASLGEENLDLEIQINLAGVDYPLDADRVTIQKEAPRISDRGFAYPGRTYVRLVP